MLTYQSHLIFNFYFLFNNYLFKAELVRTIKLTLKDKNVIFDITLECIYFKKLVSSERSIEISALEWKVEDTWSYDHEVEMGRTLKPNEMHHIIDGKMFGIL
jgi:hypothetical protein